MANYQGVVQQNVPALVRNQHGVRRRVLRKLMRLWLVVFFGAGFGHQTWAGCDTGPIRLAGKLDFPPVSYVENDQFAGIAFDLAEDIFRRLGLEVERVRPLPWPRLLRAAEEGQIDVLLSVRATANRRQSLNFVPTPIVSSSQSVFYLKKGEQADLSAFRALKGISLQGLAVPDNVAGLYPGLSSGSHTRTLPQAVRQLQQGRMDYFVAPLLPALHYFHVNQIDTFDFVREPLFVTAEKVAFSRRSPCRKWLEPFDRQLQELVARGEVDARLEKAMLGWQLFRFFR